MKSRIGFSLALLALASISVLLGQVSLQATHSGFEVASVKPARSPDGRSLIQAFPGRLQMQNLTLRRLILNAYGIQDYQLAGDPAWLASDHYDIQATTTDKTSVQEMEGPMLQILLEERFKLIVHRETRELPVYELVANKGGAKLQRSKEDSCTPYSVDSAPPPAPAPGQRLNYCGLRVTADGVNRSIGGKGVTIAVFASALARNYTSNLGRSVIDRTGIPGTFDVQLNWALDPLTSWVSVGAAAPPDFTGPSLATALQDQLGLKLQSGKGSVEVLVVDHIERASSN